eukprot:374223-Prorocentrum_minimum.AAC.1
MVRSTPKPNSPQGGGWGPEGRFHSNPARRGRRGFKIQAGSLQARSERAIDHVPSLHQPQVAAVVFNELAGSGLGYVYAVRLNIRTPPTPPTAQMPRVLLSSNLGGDKLRSFSSSFWPFLGFLGALIQVVFDGKSENVDCFWTCFWKSPPHHPVCFRRIPCCAKRRAGPRGG